MLLSACVGGLAERDEANIHAPTHTAASSSTASTHNPAITNHPGIMQKPGIPAQQMQRTGTRNQACGRGTDQNQLAEHAQHAPQPRSIAWESRGEER